MVDKSQPGRTKLDTSIEIDVTASTLVQRLVGGPRRAAYKRREHGGEDVLDNYSRAPGRYNIIFVWLDLKNLNYESDPCVKTSIKGLRELARGIL